MRRDLQKRPHNPARPAGEHRGGGGTTTVNTCQYIDTTAAGVVVYLEDIKVKVVPREQTRRAKDESEAPREGAEEEAEVPLEKAPAEPQYAEVAKHVVNEFYGAGRRPMTGICT